MRIRLEGEFPPERLDKVLARRLPEFTRETLKRWILEGRVVVDGESKRPRDLVGPGSTIDVAPGPPPQTSAQPDASVEFGVVFEDESLLVVNKPAGLVVHPGRGHRTKTLVNGLLARPGVGRLPSDPLDSEGQFRPGIVHRIDRDTSGLLVVAKTEMAREGLKKQLSEHTVERAYLALTRGVPREGKIATLHGRDPKRRMRFSCQVLRGKQAVTHISVEKVLGEGKAGLVRCTLETGRTHQIRVHLSQHRGTPLLADALYGGFRGAAPVVSIEKNLARHALHAAVLGFVHPITGQRHRFEEPLPADMAEALAALERL